jgi:hypothetical protein
MTTKSLLTEDPLDVAARAVLPAAAAFALAYSKLESLRDEALSEATSTARPRMRGALANYPARVAGLLCHLGLRDVIEQANVALFGTPDGIAERFTAGEVKINAQMRTLAADESPEAA